MTGLGTLPLPLAGSCKERPNLTLPLMVMAGVFRPILYCVLYPRDCLNKQLHSVHGAIVWLPDREIDIEVSGL